MRASVNSTAAPVQHPQYPPSPRTGAPEDHQAVWAREEQQVRLLSFSLYIFLTEPRFLDDDSRTRPDYGFHCWHT